MVKYEWFNEEYKKKAELNKFAYIVLMLLGIFMIATDEINFMVEGIAFFVVAGISSNTWNKFLIRDEVEKGINHVEEIMKIHDAKFQELINTRKRSKK